MIAGLQLVPLARTGGEGAPGYGLLNRLAEVAQTTLAVSCEIESVPLCVDPLYDDLRGQAWSTAILARLLERRVPRETVVLGVTELDLYVPVLTFVFSEAQLNGPCAVISAHRLRDEYYGMPPNDEMLVNRLLKEALHELGHTQGLRHCTNWQCVMSSAHTVERIDIRQAAFCPACASHLVSGR